MYIVCFTCCQEQYPLSGIIPGPILFFTHDRQKSIDIRFRCLTYDNILASFPTGDEEKIKSPMSITMIGFYFQRLKLILTVSECLGIP